MKEQKYEKNFASYCDVVSASRLSRRLEFIAKDFDSLISQLSILIGDSNVPKEAGLLRSQLWSLQFKADKKYRDLYKVHVENLSSSF